MAPGKLDKEDVEAIGAEVKRRLTPSEVPAFAGPEPHADLDEHVAAEAKSSWRKWLSVLFGVLGVVAGGGIAWGGSQVLLSTQAKDIETLQAAVEKKADKADAEKREDRLRAAEIEQAALKASNTVEHGTLTEKIADVKKDTVEVKNDVQKVREDVSDMKRDLAEIKKAVLKK